MPRAYVLSHLTLNTYKVLDIVAYVDNDRSFLDFYRQKHYSNITWLKEEHVLNPNTRKMYVLT